MLIMKIIVFLCLNFVWTCNNVNNFLAPSYLNYDYKQDEFGNSTHLEEEISKLKHLQSKAKRVACMILSRNSLAKGNERFKEVLRETKIDLSLTFDKAVLLMIESCENKINNQQVKQIFDPKYVLNISKEQDDFLAFDPGFFKDPSRIVKFSAEEISLLGEVHEITYANLMEDFDYLDAQNSLEFHRAKSKFIFIFAFFIFVLILCYIYYRKSVQSKNVSPQKIRSKKKNK